ncbi:MAG: hypothetical protein D6820_18405, partial [Lentisphaerae bacterium]
MGIRLWGFIIFSVMCWHAGSAELSRQIDNPLGMEFPWDLVSMDFPGELKGPWVARIGESRRPCQIEPVSDARGNKRSRVWFIATVPAKAKQVTVTFQQGISLPPLVQMHRHDGRIWVDNGISEYRLRDYSDVKFPAPLNRIPHWLSGMRLKGEKVWDGRAFFEGTSVVEKVDVKIERSGPVFVDIVYRFIFQGRNASGETESIVLKPGKQSFRYPPNQIPTIKLPAWDRYYEVRLRFVGGDPWTEVVERYHLPPDPKVKSWGIHQYYMCWGDSRVDAAKELIDLHEDDRFNLDTVMWIRWFLYDRFGGNTSLGILPLRDRPDQKGRPFALLRPRWNQGGGGAQDFFMTRGGQPALSMRDKAAMVSRRIRDLRKKEQKKNPLT